VELAERMRKRDAGSAPAMGDRVAYVIIQVRELTIQLRPVAIIIIIVNNSSNIMVNSWLFYLL
jgi:hypothetical protein